MVILNIVLVIWYILLVIWYILLVNWFILLEIWYMLLAIWYILLVVFSFWNNLATLLGMLPGFHKSRILKNPKIFFLELGQNLKNRLLR
jgi:hypothetical protein